MSGPWRLAITVLVTAALIALVAAARGHKHHRGDETGAGGVTHIALRQGGADG